MKKNFSVFASALLVVIIAFAISVISYANTSKGDVNLDGKISVADAKLVLKHVASIKALSEEQLDLADVNGDGKISVTDAKWILQIVAELREPPSQTTVETVTPSTTETQTTTQPSEDTTDAPAADLTALKEKIAQAENIDLAYYTEETAEALTKALEEARRVADMQNPTAKQVSDACNKLDSAVSSLKSLRQYLEELLAVAQSIDTTGCETSMISQLNFRINFANKALGNEDALPGQLKTAIRFLLDSIDKIDTYKNQLSESKQKLSEKINEAKAIDTSKKTEGSAYIKDRTDDLKKALDNAQAVYASPSSTQTEVDAALENLETCIEKLKTYKQYLDETIKSAVALYNDPRPDIGSINDKENKLIREKLAQAKADLLTAVNKAKAVYNNGSASDEMYKSAQDELLEAVKIYNNICDGLPKDAIIDWQ